MKLIKHPNVVHLKEVSSWLSYGFLDVHLLRGAREGPCWIEGVGMSHWIDVD